SGFDVVAEAVGLAARVETADVVITGEGSFDSQSMQGKTTGRVVAMAEEAGKRCVVLAGIADGAPVAGIEVRTLFETEPDRARAMKNAASLVEGLAARWAAEQPAD
ncbi:MAG: glycerate kinase, partial [Tepidiformaceae bacterium]